MTTSTRQRRTLARAAAVCATLGLGLADASGQVIFRDDFNGGFVDTNGASLGAGGPENVDTTQWRLPFDTEGTFVGRTRYRGDSAVDIPQQNVTEIAAADGAVLELDLDTFSPIDPGAAFLGTDLLTKRNFAGGGGLRFSSSLRLKPGAVNTGLIGGFFTFDVVRDEPDPAGGPDPVPVRDEIDFELITNATNGTAGVPINQVATNYFNDDNFTTEGAGAGLEFSSSPPLTAGGVDLTQFNDYSFEWVPGQSIEWFVNGTSIRTETTDIPEDPQQLHFNLWAPESDFAAAFDAALQPAPNAGANQTFTAQVDYVEVERFNTTASANLLTNGDFETIPNDPGGGGFGDFPDLPGNGITTTPDVWFEFGNVNYISEGQAPNLPDDLPEGIFGVSMFGPFFENGSGSGVRQLVDGVTPGEQYELSAQAITDGDDSIVGTDNFLILELNFADASGNILGENGFQFPQLDGRDPNAMSDIYIDGTTNAIAPEGAEFAVATLLFIQLDNDPETEGNQFDGGAAIWDNVSLVRLDPPISVNPGIPGDFDGDGDVDDDDFGVFAGAFGGSGPLGDFDGDGDVDDDDFGVFAGNFGTGVPSTSIPEPASAALVALAALAMSGRRARD